MKGKLALLAVVAAGKDAQNFWFTIGWIALHGVVVDRHLWFTTVHQIANDVRDVGDAPSGAVFGSFDIPALRCGGKSGGNDQYGEDVTGKFFGENQ